MHRISLLFTVLLLAACVTPVSTDGADAPGSNANEADNIDLVRDVPDTGLPAQRLAPGECAIFLWSKTDASKFVFFVRGGAATALMLLEGEPVEISLTDTDGELFEEFFTKLTYQTVAGQKIDISFQPGERLQDGTRLPLGRIQYADEEGWSTVLPVIGVHACQPIVQSDPNAGVLR